MRVAQVVGSVVSTIKAESLRGAKLLIVRETTLQGEPVGDPLVAVDAVGAGEGEVVLITRGSAARFTAQTTDTPVDAVIMAIVDTLEVAGQTTFRAS